MITQKQWNQICDTVRKLQREGHTVYYYDAGWRNRFLVDECDWGDDRIQLDDRRVIDHKCIDEFLSFRDLKYRFEICVNLNHPFFKELTE